MEKMDEKIYKNRMLILLNLVLVTFMATLDGSIVNVALPKMAKELSVSTQSIAWVVTSYFIVITSTILICGRLGDITGKIKVFKYGLVLFTLGSLLGGLSNSLWFLIIARIIQAFGAAGTMATNQGITTQVFPANERGKALGITGTFVALGNLLGPPLGGFIVGSMSWKYIFLINIPIGIFAFIMGMKILPRTESGTSEKLDLKGAFFFIITVLSLFGSVIFGGETGYAHPAVISGFVVAAVSFVVFILVETKLAAPLLQLKIFENPLFSLSIFCGFLSFVSIGFSTIIQPFYLQSALKLSPVVTGMIMMVYPLILAVVAPISGNLSDKIGSEFLTFVGLLLTSTGLYLTSTLNERSGIPVLLAFTAVTSVGNGLFQSPNTSLIMSTVPRNKLGIAGSINALVRNLGLVSGISLSTTLLYSRMSAKLGYRTSNYVQGRDDIFIYGMKGVYITAVVICATGAVLTAFRLYRKRTDARGTGGNLREESSTIL